MEADKVVDIPRGGPCVTVKMINPLNFGFAEVGRLMAPSVPGLEYFPKIPSLCFLLEHPSGRKLVWDLVSNSTNTMAIWATLSPRGVLPRLRYLFVFEAFTNLSSIW